MSPNLPHEMECARAAIAARIEGAASRIDRQERRNFLKELERDWAKALAADES